MISLLPIQIILLALLGAFIAYIFRFRTPLRDRALYVVIGSCGVVTVLVPSLTSRAARLIGVGRGTDLLLYIFVLFSLLNVVSLSTQLRRMERQITLLIRQSAIADAEIGRIEHEQHERLSAHNADYAEDTMRDFGTGSAQERGMSG